MSKLKCPHCGKDVYPDPTPKYAAKYKSTREKLLALRERNHAIAETYATGAVSMKEVGIVHNLSIMQVSLALYHDHREQKRMEKYEKAFHECSSYMEMPIEVLDLTGRTRHGLEMHIFDIKNGFMAYHYMAKHRDAVTVGEVLKTTDQELMEIPNFGRTSIYEWKQCLVMLMADFADRKPALSHRTSLHPPLPYV